MSKIEEALIEYLGEDAPTLNRGALPAKVGWSLIS